MNKKQIIIVALLSVAVVAFIVTICVVVFKKDDVLVPDYAPPVIESNVEKIEGETDEKLEAGEGGGAVGLEYSKAVTVDLSDEKAYMVFANPAKSYNSMLLQVVVQDRVIAQSGTLEPGYRISTDGLALVSGAAAMLIPGVYSSDVKFVINYYDPENHEKAILNTEIPITITVQE